jgi:hypothetical protein
MMKHGLLIKFLKKYDIQKKQKLYIKTKFIFQFIIDKCYKNSTLAMKNPNKNNYNGR